MNIAIAQQDYHIGNFDFNFQQLQKGVQQAAQQKADIVLFPELAVCGYPPRDFLEFDNFIKQSQQVISKLLPLSLQYDIAIIVGAPQKNPDAEGKDLFNAAYFLAEGKIQHVIHKTLLPTYDIFDEYRYFEPGDNFEIIHYKGYKIALTICEDIWNIGNDNPLYEICPMDHLIKQKPDVMLNLSASPFSYTQAVERLHICHENVKRYQIPLLYCNTIGAHTEIIFDGGSIVIDKAGNLIDELPYFTEAIRTYKLADLIAAPAKPKAPNPAQNKDTNRLIYEALLLGIRDYFRKLGFTKAILGLSGGIDSALVLALAAHALGKENVLAVMMPSQYSSDHSITDSEKLCKNLGCPSYTIPIQEPYTAFLNTLQAYFGDLPMNVAEENIQARSRAVILMALSNKFGYILLNTSNKSEAAVGYGTLYGDMAGGLSVIGDVYKTQAYQLANYINERFGQVIPQNIITKPPSAELRPHQKDSDSLPDYDLLDQVLYHYIEKRKGPQELINMGFDKALVNRILALVNRSEYKRYQTPPMLRVSQKAFGVGRRIPIVAKYLS